MICIPYSTIWAFCFRRYYKKKIWDQVGCKNSSIFKSPTKMFVFILFFFLFSGESSSAKSRLKWSATKLASVRCRKREKIVRPHLKSSVSTARPASFCANHELDACIKSECICSFWVRFFFFYFT